MSYPHDREPVDKATIDCWRINYGLDKRTPAQAARWWHENLRGFAPSGCVAALGVALDELEALRKDAERLDYIAGNARCDPKMDGQHVWWPTSFNRRLTGPTLRDAIDSAMAPKRDGAA